MNTFLTLDRSNRFFVRKYNGVLASLYSNYKGWNNLMIHFKINLREGLNKYSCLLLLLLVSTLSLDSASGLGTKFRKISFDIYSNKTSIIPGQLNSVIRLRMGIFYFGLIEFVALCCSILSTYCCILLSGWSNMHVVSMKP